MRLTLLGPGAEAAVQPISAPRQAARALTTVLMYATTGVNLGPGVASDDPALSAAAALAALSTPAAHIQWFIALWIERYIVEDWGVLRGGAERGQ